MSGRRRKMASGGGLGPAGADARRGRRGGLALALALLLVGAAVVGAHAPVLRAQALCFDDYSFVRDNPLVSHPGWTSTGRFFVEVLSPSTVRGYYLPLSMTSLMLDYAAGGRADDLRVFHRTSLALHVLATLLVVVLLYRLFGALVPAAIAGLLFGLHPLTVEPVAWVGERKTLLAALFSFACLACHVESARRDSRGWRGASVACYALALLSKPTATTLPLLLLLLDAWPLRRLGWRTVREKWPFAVLALASAAITLVSHQRTAGIEAVTRGDVLQWPLRAGWLLAFYLAKIVRPVDLSPAYLAPAPFGLANPAVLAGVAGVVLLTVLLVVAARRAPGPLAGWLFFALALGPTLGFLTYSWVIASDKYVYLPALGVLLALAPGLRGAWESPRARGLARRALLLAPVLLIAGAEWRGTRATLESWTDTRTLLRHMEGLAPGSPVVQGALGSFLETRGDSAEAVLHLRRAVEIAPDYVPAQTGLGIALARRGEIAESIAHLERAVALAPADPEAAYGLGSSLRLAGRLDEAEAQFRRALRLAPDQLGALDQLGAVLAMEGRASESAAAFRRAVALNPASPVLRYRLARALLLAGDRPAEAAEELRRVVRATPDAPQPVGNLAWLLATCPDPAVRDTAEALRLARRTVELTGGRSARALDVLAAAQAAARRFDAAARTARQAIALARAHGDDATAREIAARLALYERGALST